MSGECESCNEHCIDCECSKKIKDKHVSSHGWISVKDRLPELYDFVLVFADNKGSSEPGPTAIARMVHEHGIWDMLGNLDVGAYQDIECGMDREDITHWMPLPETPK